MSIFKISEKFVLNKLKSIKEGNLKLINYDGQVYHFGNLEDPFTADIKIINPSFYLNIILGGSSALGEAHINKDLFFLQNFCYLIKLKRRKDLFYLLHLIYFDLKVQNYQYKLYNHSQLN